MTFIHYPQLQNHKIDKFTVNQLDCPHLFVMRPKVGEIWKITNLKGVLATVRILNWDKSKHIIHLEIIEREVKVKNIETCPALVCAITDKSYLDQMIEIIPFTIFNNIFLFNSDRSPIGSVNLKRLESILIKSLEQSEQVFLPQIMILDNLDTLQLDQQSIYFDCLKDNLSATKYQGKLNGEKIKYCLIGPEGGWSTQEIELFAAKNMQKICLESLVYPAWFMPVVVSNLL
jgi:RsmE family RNA methyltransferase